MWCLYCKIICFSLGHLCLVPPGGVEQLCCSLSLVFFSGLIRCTSSGWVRPLCITLYFIGVGASTVYYTVLHRGGCVHCVLHCSSSGWVRPLCITLYFIGVGASTVYYTVLHRGGCVHCVLHCTSSGIHCVLHCTSSGWVRPLCITLYFIGVGVSTVHQLYSNIKHDPI